MATTANRVWRTSLTHKSYTRWITTTTTITTAAAAAAAATLNIIFAAVPRIYSEYAYDGRPASSATSFLTK